MKISPRIIDDLMTLVQHARIDISFGEGGSYNHEVKGEWPFDKKEAKKTERAIAFIRKIILERE